MVSHSHEQEPLFQNSIFDDLYCEEERFDENVGSGFLLKEQEFESFPFLLHHDLLWEDEELSCLLLKQQQQQTLSLTYDLINSDRSLKIVRNEGIKWMMKVIGYYGFNPKTTLLAVNCYDRFITSNCFQKDKPWMSQLTAVACLSLAAKVEETQVPLLIDLQVEESKYLFEAKTIQRMELLVLSTLHWKMNPVTPLSFIDHIARRFELIKNLHWEFLRRCESVILSISTDCRSGHYLPSVLAAATMIYVIREREACDDVVLEYQNQVMNVLKTSKETIDDCHNLITETMGDYSYKPCQKRKHEPIPSSPSGVIDAYFSSDSSDSWAVASPGISSPVCKRTRSQNQAPLNGVSVIITAHPH